MTATSTLREDRSDTKRSLAHHVSGDEYVVIHCSLWDEDDRCVGARIVAATGPISRHDLSVEEPLEPSRELFDRIDDGDWEMSDGDAAWLQEEEDAGRLTYPIGAR